MTFYHRNHQNGLNAFCKSCRAKDKLEGQINSNKSTYSKKIDSGAAKPLGARTCSACNETLMPDKFSQHKLKAKGGNVVCLECQAGADALRAERAARKENAKLLKSSKIMEELVEKALRMLISKEFVNRLPSCGNQMSKCKKRLKIPNLFIFDSMIFSYLLPTATSNFIRC